jgi:hypothetical protein
MPDFSEEGKMTGRKMPGLTVWSSSKVSDAIKFNNGRRITDYIQKLNFLGS